MNLKKIIIPLILFLVPYFFGQAFLLKLLPDFYWAQSFLVDTIWIKSLKLEALTFFSFFFIAYLGIRSQFSVALRLAKKTQKDPLPNLISKPLGFIFDLFKAYQQFLNESRVLSLSSKILSLGTELLIFFLSFSLAWQAKSNWLDIQLAFHAVPFGSTDPLFQKDISFYLMQFPLITTLLSWVSFVLFLAFCISLWVYFSKGSLLKIFISEHLFTPKKHLATLLSLIVLGMSAGYYLNQFSILFSARGSVFGAGYTDFNVMLLFYTVQLFALLALAIAIFFGDFFQPSALSSLLLLLVSSTPLY